MRFIDRLIFCHLQKYFSLFNFWLKSSHTHRTHCTASNGKSFYFSFEMCACWKRFIEWQENRARRLFTFSSFCFFSFFFLKRVLIAKQLSLHAAWSQEMLIKITNNLGQSIFVYSCLHLIRSTRSQDFFLVCQIQRNNDERVMRICRQSREIDRSNCTTKTPGENRHFDTVADAIFVFRFSRLFLRWIFFEQPSIVNTHVDRRLKLFFCSFLIVHMIIARAHLSFNYFSRCDTSDGRFLCWFYQRTFAKNENFWLFVGTRRKTISTFILSFTLTNFVLN